MYEDFSYDAFSFLPLCKRKRWSWHNEVLWLKVDLVVPPDLEHIPTILDSHYCADCPV